MAHDLDFNIVACTALNQKYWNHADHVMSTLNHYQQDVATARESMEPAKKIEMESLQTLGLGNLQKQTPLRKRI